MAEEQKTFIGSLKKTVKNGFTVINVATKFITAASPSPSPQGQLNKTVETYASYDQKKKKAEREKSQRAGRDVTVAANGKPPKNMAAYKVSLDPAIKSNTQQDGIKVSDFKQSLGKPNKEEKTKTVTNSNKKGQQNTM